MTYPIDPSVMYRNTVNLPFFFFLLSGFSYSLLFFFELFQFFGSKTVVIPVSRSLYCFETKKDPFKKNKSLIYQRVVFKMKASVFFVCLSLGLLQLLLKQIDGDDEKR